MTAPRWQQIDQDYPQARKRLGFGTRMGLMLTGLLPTYQMERNWPGDQLRMYGASARTTLPSSTGRLNAISLHNASSPLLPREDWRELLVWKVTARSFTGGVILPNWIESSMQDFHVFTPLAGYNPHNFPDTFPNVFAFLQPLDPDRVAAFPTAHLDVGSNINLMTVIVNGVPTAGIGPRLAQTPSVWVLAGSPPGSVGFGAAQDMDYIPSGDAPPFRVLPGQRMTVQQLIFPATTLQGIEASFWWSERLFAQGN